MNLKAEALLETMENVKPGKYISWPVYDGDNIVDAKSVEDYVTVFFKTGDVMPIPFPGLGLNIQSVQTEYAGDEGHHKVVIEALVVKLKEGK